jgi:hypothetical protein
MKRHHDELAAAFSTELSRRELLRRAGYGAAALLALGVAPAEARAARQLQRLLPGVHAVSPAAASLLVQALGDSSQPVLQLPFWGDGANWDQPQYYETIQAGRRTFPNHPKTVQSADVDGDGQDELLARGPGGMLVNRFDPDTGQWLTLPGKTPDLSDANGWNNPQYYRTIQTADIDGDGSAELLGRSSDGMHTWKYDPSAAQWTELPQILTSLSDAAGWGFPWYYETLQCADIDGDGRAELLGRGFGGIVPWKYRPGLGWMQLPPGPPWSNSNGWTNPQYYLTIQCADIDGDGADELLGRSADGMHAWKFDLSTAGFWRELSPVLPISDANDWWASYYYQTIQCADLDGDGGAELLARAGGGIVAWKYDSTNQTWNQLAPGPPWSNNAGWQQAYYYGTIQCADIDGDGSAELLARDGGVMEAWKYNPTSNNWSQLHDGPPWSNIAGWQAVQYYSTIQTARVKGSASNPNNPPAPKGKPVAALLGRDALSMKTWRFDGTAQNWGRTSAPWPQFTGDQLTAYVELDKTLRGLGASGNIRDTYNDETAPLATWMAAMYTTPPLSYDMPPAQRPAPNLSAPANVSAADWAAVTWQIYWEMSWVLAVNDWYGNKTNALITDIYLGKDLTLQTVGDYLNLPSDSNSTVALSVLSLLFNGASSVLGFAEPGSALNSLAPVAGIFATAVGAAASFLPDGGSIQEAYASLQSTLTSIFNDVLTANGQNQQAITGGSTAGSNHPGDYGLLAAIGQQIQSTLWSWPSTTDDVVATAQRSYALSLWRALIPLKWLKAEASIYGPPAGYPTKYLYVTGSTNADRFWISTSTSEKSSYPAAASLEALFDKQQTGQLFPLGVPLNDVFEGDNGWPRLRLYDFDGGWGATPRSSLPARGVDLRVSVVLSREAQTGEILATVTLDNQGLSGATNVELVEALLRNGRPLDGMPSRHTHLAAGKSTTLHLRFPTTVGAAGQTALLRLSGKYLGGTFGSSFRMRLP